MLRCWKWQSVPDNDRLSQAFDAMMAHVARYRNAFAGPDGTRLAGFYTSEIVIGGQALQVVEIGLAANDALLAAPFFFPGFLPGEELEGGAVSNGFNAVDTRDCEPYDHHIESLLRIAGKVLGSELEILSPPFESGRRRRLRGDLAEMWAREMAGA